MKKVCFTVKLHYLFEIENRLVHVLLYSILYIVINTLISAHMRLEFLSAFSRVEACANSRRALIRAFMVWSLGKCKCYMIYIINDGDDGWSNSKI